MAMGKRRARQQAFWVAATELPRSRGHVFYDRVNEILQKAGFDAFAEKECRQFYKSETMGRPSLAPGVYFRLLMMGYFEGIDSERGMAWRCADSLSLKRFLGYELTDATPDHTTVSRTRRLVDLETHGRVFTWILKLLVGEGLIDGKTIGVDATTLEANAAMKSPVRAAKTGLESKAPTCSLDRRGGSAAHRGITSSSGKNSFHASMEQT